MQLIYIHAPDELTQAPTLRVEETEWVSRVAPTPFSLQRFDAWALEQNETAANLEVGLDHSDWQVFISPVYAYSVPQVFSCDENIIGASATFGADEDFWVCGVAPVANYAAPRAFVDDDTVVPVPPIQDEDFWRNPVAPVFAYAVRVFVDDDCIFPQPQRRDEDYWRDPVAPVQATNFLVLPYLPDVEEIPAGSLFVALPPSVSGVGQVTPQVSGAGVVTVSSGVGSVSGEVAGSGRIN